MKPKEVKDFMRQDRWNESNASAYDAYRRLSRRDGWKRFLAKALAKVPAGTRVLEVGSGTGFITSILVELGFEVEGIDLSEAMLTVARANLEKESLAQKVRLSQGDAESLAYPDNHFQAVVSRWVLWTLPRPAEAIGEMARVLKPGGTVLLVDGSRLKPGAFGQMRSSLVNWILTGRRPGWRGPDYKKVEPFLPHFNPDQTAAAFQANGLNVLDVWQALENETDGKVYAWLMGGTWSSYCVKAAKPSC
jgi:ubiquinone/menaquinone biosynthesis C-methylase UbiE